MKTFIISGAPGTGKTSRVHYLCDWLLKDRGYRLVINYLFVQSVYSPNVTIDDFTCLLEKNGKKVLLHSPSDDKYHIDNLKKHIDCNAPDILITTCRDYNDWPREYFCNILGLKNGLLIKTDGDISIDEYSLAKITRRGKRFLDTYDWYWETTINQIKKILVSSPYFL